MKKIVLLLLAVCAVIGMEAQQLSVLSFSAADKNDITARREARKDSNGKNCALIRVGIVGINDMKFPDAVGQVIHEGSEYQVYVPDGLQSLRYNGSGGRIKGVVKFSNYPKVGAVASNSVYRLNFDTDDHKRLAIIKVTPKTATLILDGLSVKLDADGMATVEKPVGSYRYQLSAPQYESQEGTIVFERNELSTTKTINMEHVTHVVSIKGAPSDANLSVDGVSYGPISINRNPSLPEGRHTIRLQAEGFDDYEQVIDVKAGMSPLNITMQQKRLIEKIDKSNESRTNVNLRPGHYLSISGHLFDKKKYDAQQWGLSFNYSAMQHFAAIFALREGISLGWSYMNKDEIKNTFDATPKDSTTMYVDVPLQIGFSVPVNSFRTSLISIMAGGYGKYMWTEMEGGDKNKKDAWDYGLRLSAILEVSKIIIGAEVSSSLNKKRMFYGVSIGYNLGRSNKKD